MSEPALVEINGDLIEVGRIICGNCAAIIAEDWD
jgi:hypothetical protein